MNKFLEEVEEKMPTMIQIKNYISTWVENNMTILNLRILKRYPKYPGYEKAVREYKEYISCPEKLVLGYYTPKTKCGVINKE